jgi:hypothetical protein
VIVNDYQISSSACLILCKYSSVQSIARHRLRTTGVDRTELGSIQNSLSGDRPHIPCCTFTLTLGGYKCCGSRTSYGSITVVEINADMNFDENTRFVMCGIPVYCFSSLSACLKHSNEPVPDRFSACPKTDSQSLVIVRDRTQEANWFLVALMLDYRRN